VVATSTDFAIGEFGIATSNNVPEVGSTLVYAFFALLGLGGFRRCFGTGEL
jgi:hypothetical protein